jgi:hypothetical protein
MYNKQEVESYLRNYTTLCMSIVIGGNDEFHLAKMDLDNAMRKLQSTSDNLYNTVLGVFVYGNPIQEQAKQMNVSKRQIMRRMDDGLHMLTMIMNGEVL